MMKVKSEGLRVSCVCVCVHMCVCVCVCVFACVFCACPILYSKRNQNLINSIVLNSIVLYGAPDKNNGSMISDNIVTYPSRQTPYITMTL